MISLIPLSDIDSVHIEKLLDKAFGEDRLSRTSYRVREDMEQLERLCFGAIDDEAETLVGTIQCWPTMLSEEDANGEKTGRRHPMIMVGPVAVTPDRQGAGIGKMLIAAMLAEVEDNEQLPLIMIGDPEYYGRFFDFKAELTGGWKLPGPCEPSRLLMRLPSQRQVPQYGTVGPYKPASSIN